MICNTFKYLNIFLNAGSKQHKVAQPGLTLRIHRGRRSNSVPRESGHDVKFHLKASKSIDSTSLDRRKQLQRDDGDIMAHKSPILHMMQITLNRKENMETLLCKPSDETAGSSTLSANSSPAMIKRGSESGSKTRRSAGKRVLKVQAKRFRVETKAAKTLAIIVGGFILCWCPFFTIYVIRTFCRTCIQPLMFSVMFWLGYCNSALNPLIYAMFSKEFRRAYKDLICRCMCSETMTAACQRGGGRRGQAYQSSSSQSYHIGNGGIVMPPPAAPPQHR